MHSNDTFEYSKFTAVISDLHLCEAEPINEKFPLWKKFKTKEFFYDNDLELFFNHIVELANGETVELVLNGDIFDFDGVMRLPQNPPFSISWIEKQRGLHARPERSLFKIKVILDDHPQFISALTKFIMKGNKLVFVIGNHDIELHNKDVQEEIIRRLELPADFLPNVRFTEWFYISNKDTFIEHGNQYDPYCVCEDPVNPFVKGYNFVYLKLPFGNLASRYIMNGLGFFNPHSDSNYIMSLYEYLRIFFKYMFRAQPFLVLTWFSGSLMTLFQSLFDFFSHPARNPLTLEERIQNIAQKSNCSPRIVREMKELSVEPAIHEPLSLLKELWLDRAFIILFSFFVIFEIMILIKSIYSVSFFWALIPLFLLLPFFLFYSKSIISMVSGYKEPDDRVLAMTSFISKVNRVVYGHTHIPRHEIIGSVEHLNSGCWSPAFKDVECKISLDQKTFVWIFDDGNGSRKAELLIFKDGLSKVFRRSSGRDAT